MMSGVAGDHSAPSRSMPRVYRVISRAGGWSIVLNGACTRPFRNRRAAERIARSLQKQADGLSHALPTVQH